MYSAVVIFTIMVNKRIFSCPVCVNWKRSLFQANIHFNLLFNCFFQR